MKPTTFALGILTLIALEVLVTTPATGYLGELVQVPAGLLKRLIDPTVPLIGGGPTDQQTLAQMRATTGLLGPTGSLPPVPSAQNSLGR